MGAFVEALDGLFAEWRLDLRAESVREAKYLELCPPALRPPHERIWRHTMDLRPVSGASGELPAATDNLPYRDTIHLTLGTVFNENRPVLSTALEGLLDLPANLVVTVGPTADRASLGPQPRHVLIALYLPHLLLLPRCRLVVSQGGAGIMFGALAHGLPQLILPQGGDQFSNAEASTAAGAALTLLPAEVTPTAAAAAATRLLTELSFAAAAARVQAEIAAMPTADAVLRSLTAAPTSA